MSTVYVLLSIAQMILVIGATIGGFFGFRNARRATLVTLQRETIEALQQQIDALKDKQADLEKENAHLHYLIETIQAALTQSGSVVTITGDLVTIRDANGNVSKSMGRRPGETN